MSYLRLLQAARQEFRTLSPQQNVIVLHPQFRYHNALVNALMEDGDRRIVYVTLPGPETTLESLWAQLQSLIDDAYGIDLDSPSSFEPDTVAQHLVSHLNRLAPLLLVWGAFDFAGDSITALVAALAEHAGNELISVVDSRVWPEALVRRVARHQIAVMPASTPDMLLDYLAHDESRVLLEVRALGSGQVLINGREINQWDGALPRALFFYFVDRGMTTRDEVFSTFWPELSTREATNVFHVTKRKISEILGVDLTVYSSGFYRIAPNIDLYYDVVSFVESVQNAAVSEPDEAIVLLERALQLHEREFLAGVDQPWAKRRRAELLEIYVDALAGLARIHEEQGRAAEALGLYARAFSIHSQREDLARAVMQHLANEGQHDQALTVYRRLTEELSSSLGVAPSPETEALAAVLQQAS
ncbi:MAG: hypothetical protein Kow0077_18770 [Anaerolineae bacterium]